jgi:hypothetical protein
MGTPEEYAQAQAGVGNTQNQMYGGFDRNAFMAQAAQARQFAPPQQPGGYGSWGSAGGGGFGGGGFGDAFGQAVQNMGPTTPADIQRQQAYRMAMRGQGQI